MANDNDQADASKSPPPEQKVETPRQRAERRGLKPWKKGEGGRPKGIRNRTTRVLKELILIAADVTGSDGKGKDGAVGYLSWLARREPAVFGNLLGKVLPLQLQMSTPPGEGDANKDRYTASELRAQLISRGLRVPTLIDVTPDREQETVPSAPEEQPEQQQEEEDVENE